jgi:hypothetical protein
MGSDRQSAKPRSRSTCAASIVNWATATFAASSASIAASCSSVNAILASGLTGSGQSLTAWPEAARARA